MGSVSTKRNPCTTNLHNTRGARTNTSSSGRPPRHDRDHPKQCGKMDNHTRGSFTKCLQLTPELREGDTRLPCCLSRFYSAPCCMYIVQDRPRGHAAASGVTAAKWRFYFKSKPESTDEAHLDKNPSSSNNVLPDKIGLASNC